MTVLWLLRHGQTDWNLEGRWQGQSPHAPGLNSAGRAQAITVGKTLSGEAIASIYSSDLLRARQTAELIAGQLGQSITLEPRLREIHLGLWEGMLHDEIASRYPAELAERARDPLGSRAPGGETLVQVAERVLPAVDEIARGIHPGPVLIVSHGVVLAILVCHARRIAFDATYEHVPENTVPCRVEWD